MVRTAPLPLRTFLVFSPETQSAGQEKMLVRSTLLMRWWRLCSRLELLRLRGSFHTRQPFKAGTVITSVLRREATLDSSSRRGYSDCGPGRRASSMGLSWFTASSSWFIPSARETRSLLSSGSRRDPCGLPEARSTGRVCDVHRQGDGVLAPWALGPVVACKAPEGGPAFPGGRLTPLTAGESQGLKPQLKTPEGCGGHYL